MKRHFRRSATSDLGPGQVWIEFEDETPTRQVERYGDRWFSSRDEYHAELGPGLSDQPLSETELGTAEEIEADEFERAWDESAG